MKNSMLSLKTLLVVTGFAAFTLSSCDNDDNDTMPDDPMPATVVEVIFLAVMTDKGCL